MKNDTTIIKFLIDSAHKYAGLEAMKYLKRGDYVSIHWNETFETTRALSLGFQAIGLKHHGRVALMSKTRYEWRLVDYGILFAGGVTVTLYPSLVPKQVEYIINDSNCEYIVVDKVRNLKKVLKIRDQCPNLKYIICISPFPEELKSDTVFGLDELVEKGGHYERTTVTPSSNEAFNITKEIEKISRKIQKTFKEEKQVKFLEKIYELNEKYADMTNDPFIKRYLMVKEEDLCTIIYTSGTTGVPKGAMLTHYNQANNSIQTAAVMPIEQHDLALAFLPLSHSLERQVGQFTATLLGFCVAYARDTDSLIENLDQVKPTILTSVPRIYEKLYDRIVADILEDVDPDDEDESSKEKIFNNATDWGWEYQKTKQEVNLGREYEENDKVTVKIAFKNFLAEKLVFHKVDDILGGRLRFMFSGGAALNPVLAKFFFAAGFKIMEGYGLTETGPVLTLNRIDNIKFGTVGPPVPDTKIKIAPDGEIIAQGPQVFQGYWNKPSENEDAFSEDEEGKWYHTGDIGIIDEEGFIKITGRKKTLIVLRTGKKVSPVVTEAAISLNRHIAHMCVIGDDLKYLIGILEPNFEYLGEWLESCHIGNWTPDDFELYKGMTKVEFETRMENRKTVIELPEVKAFYDSIMEESQKNLSGYEKVKRYALVSDEWNEYGAGILTPSMKMKRKTINEYYKKLIDSIYVE